MAIATPGDLQRTMRESINGLDGHRKPYAAKWGGDTSGANLRSAAYTNNLVNQLTSRGVPGSVDVMGIAHAAATVTVNSAATDSRKGPYFHKAVSIANDSNPIWQSVSVSAVNGGSSSNWPAGSVFVPKNGETFSHDTDGNLTGDGRWTYTWDAENRLKSMESFATAPVASKRKLEFDYDWQGRRIRTLISTNNGSIYVAQSTNRFVYDGWNLVAILNPQSAIVTSFLWGLDLSGSEQGAGGVGGLLAVKPGNGVAQFVAYDGNGNVAALVDGNSGAYSANYEYGPFGEPIRVSGAQAIANPLRFSTKFTDDDTGLLYYGHRFYCPSTGRWPSRDPIGELGGKNLYAFVRNNPVGSFDTDGRMEISSCETALKRAVEGNAKAKAILAEMKKRKCPEPEPACKCCSKEERGGGFDPKSKKIAICANAWSNGAGIISAVVHELTHALDDCKGTDWSKCKERACSEIRAYDQGGTCASGGMDRQPGESYRDCIKRKATASTTADPSCTAADVESQMDACIGSGL